MLCLDGGGGCDIILGSSILAILASRGAGACKIGWVEEMEQPMIMTFDSQQQWIYSRVKAQGSGGGLERVQWILQIDSKVAHLARTAWGRDWNCDLLFQDSACARLHDVEAIGNLMKAMARRDVLKVSIQEPILVWLWRKDLVETEVVGVGVWLCLFRGCLRVRGTSRDGGILEE